MSPDHDHEIAPVRAFFSSRARSFRYAFAGLAHVMRSQPNAWIHGVATIVVGLVGIWIGLSPIEWALIVVAIGTVWMAEIANTSLEAVVDLASPQVHPLARIAKDCAAAAVLVAAGMAATIGILVLGPPLWTQLGL